MKKVSQVKGYQRRNKNGTVTTVKPHSRKVDVGVEPKVDPEALLYDLFGYAGGSLLHSVNETGVFSQNQFGKAILLGLSSDEGYQGMLEKVKTSSKAKYAVKIADAFIGRNGDTPCKGLYSGCPLSEATFKKLLKSGKVDLSCGLPVYTTPLKDKAIGFSGYLAEPNSVRCVFEVVEGNVKGNSKHFSKHIDEQEVCFKSTTKVTMVGKPEVIGEGSEDRYYHIKVKFTE
jgi:hypothetical protein